MLIFLSPLIADEVIIGPPGPSYGPCGPYPPYYYPGPEYYRDYPPGYYFNPHYGLSPYLYSPYYGGTCPYNYGGYYFYVPRTERNREDHKK